MERRFFLGSLGASVAALAGSSAGEALAELAEQRTDDRLPHDVARDESYWSAAQRAFDVDRSLVNLNNGGVSPTPRLVLDAMKRHWDIANHAPSYQLFTLQHEAREGVRRQLAGLLGSDPEEIALTRNASEGLQICQKGFDLEPGDEVLTTNQDYGRMRQTFRQLARRRGIELKEISIPVPLVDRDELVRRFESAITPRTRLILMCHVINLTGQILPVRDVVRVARKRGIPVLVDGAHSFAHFPFTADELECDYYATSLHKWLFAPHGTGMLYVRRERIADLWPLQPAPETLDDDIRKFEEIGTHPQAPHLAVAEAVLFHELLGAENKAARMHYLMRYWSDQFQDEERVAFATNRDARYSGGIATVRVEGLDTAALNRWLWKGHRILQVPIIHEEFHGLRISPSVYTSLGELDRFCDALREALRDGTGDA